MRLLIVSLLMGGLLLVNLGCTSDSGEGGIYDVTVDSTRHNTCGFSDTCSVTFWVSFRDAKGAGAEHWYWLEIGPRLG